MELILGAVALSIIVAGIIVLGVAIRRDNEQKRKNN